MKTFYNKILKRIFSVSILLIIAYLGFYIPFCNSSQNYYKGVCNDTIISITYLHDTTLYVKPPYKMSYQGIQFIKKNEGLRLKSYILKGEDGYTIGYGHRLLKNEHFHQITSQKAEELLMSDLDKAAKSAERLLSKIDTRFKFSQSFIDGFISLIFNCGEYGASTTKFYKRLSEARYDESIHNINREDLLYAAAAVTMDKISVKPHIERRKSEYLMMIK